jgi:IclR family transcriptional regulator, KDG regulon repressor
MSRSLERITAILDCFADSRTGLTAAEIADQSGLDRATALRFLGAMEEHRMVRRDPFSKRYSPGPRLIQWGTVATESIDVRIIAEPILQRLNRETEETIALYVRDGDRRICVATRQSPHEIRHVLYVGNTLRMAQAAGGHVILAGMPDEEARAILERDECLSESERVCLLNEIPRIRERGYAIGVRMMTPHAWSIAAPIFDRAGEPIATLVVSGPDVRINDEIAERHARHLVPAAQEISEALGAPRTSLNAAKMESLA